jgi:hypothetical protein
MTSPSLLQLPRELRDEIYKHILYNPSGLLYKTGKDGFSSLFQRSKERSSRKYMHTWLRKCAVGRSKIQQRTRETHKGENNQLEYVYKRLHSGTRGPESCDNSVVTGDGRHMTAVGRCIFRLRRCSMLRAAAIRVSPQSLVLEYRGSRFSAIVTHCKTHTDVAVKARVPYWSHAKPNLVLLGLSHLSTLQADSRLIAQIAQAISVSYPADSDCALLTTKIRIPLNLRLSTWEEYFNRQLFDRTDPKLPLLSLPRYDLSRFRRPSKSCSRLVYERIIKKG